MSKSITREVVFEKLFKSFNYGNLGMFIGAGFSKAVIDDGWYKALGWFELIKTASDTYGLDFPNDEKLVGVSLPELATKMCEKLSIKEGISYEKAKFLFKQEICQLSTWLPQEEKLESYREIFDILDPNWIITTNYDLVIESILTGKCKSINPLNYLTAPKGVKPIYHLHGTRMDPESIIITQEDYIPLFRPNEYRQTKLAMTIRESTTLVLGYSLGDMNVLSSLDWSKNVYTVEDEFPYDIIQVLWTKSPKNDPYYDVNGNIVIETNNIDDFLNELCLKIVEKQFEYDMDMKKLRKIIEQLENGNGDMKKRFIEDNQSFRVSMVKLLSKFEHQLITPYIQFLSECIGEVWSESSKNGAFDEYDKYLKILLDIIINYDFKQMPPRLFRIVSEALDKVMYYVSDTRDKIKGDSWKATNTWHDRYTQIPEDMVQQLSSYAKQSGLGCLNRKLKNISAVPK
ncbi:SIR2 family NAD-dependent protein deacylase [Lysinibacillus sp. NPDC097279]|uniref:SIR2 family NAD-dependent protein deacylase n=1 Tax=Lysinibacillus sp. NPDC097279 TaxID=3364143 RepID=UPI003824AD74